MDVFSQRPFSDSSISAPPPLAILPPHYPHWRYATFIIGQIPWQFLVFCLCSFDLSHHSQGEMTLICHLHSRYSNNNCMVNKWRCYNVTLIADRAGSLYSSFSKFPGCCIFSITLFQEVQVILFCLIISFFHVSFKMLPLWSSHSVITCQNPSPPSS